MSASTDRPTAARSAMPPTERLIDPSASAAAGVARPAGSALTRCESTLHLRSAASAPPSLQVRARHSAPARRSPRHGVPSSTWAVRAARASASLSTLQPRAAVTFIASSSAMADTVKPPARAVALLCTLSMICFCMAGGLTEKHCASARSAQVVSAADKLCCCANAASVAASQEAATSASPPPYSSACSASTCSSAPATAGPRISSSRESSEMRSATEALGSVGQPPARPPEARHSASNAFAAFRCSSIAGALSASCTVWNASAFTECATCGFLPEAAAARTSFAVSIPSAPSMAPAANARMSPSLPFAWGPGACALAFADTYRARIAHSASARQPSSAQNAAGALTSSITRGCARALKEVDTADAISVARVPLTSSPFPSSAATLAARAYPALLSGAPACE
mmetsp:Transcript_6335/g.25502  ORF Transcript_6335/g.25502 Transcript_6335/m.25502 type:complete len:402 (+) Transcript_6335:3183-4388(+)